MFVCETFLRTRYTVKNERKNLFFVRVCYTALPKNCVRFVLGSPHVRPDYDTQLAIHEHAQQNVLRKQSEPKIARVLSACFQAFIGGRLCPPVPPPLDVAKCDLPTNVAYAVHWDTLRIPSHGNAECSFFTIIFGNKSLHKRHDKRKTGCPLSRRIELQTMLRHT